VSIDARIRAVTQIFPGDCDFCDNTGKDDNGWDDCPSCHGTSTGKKCLRLHLEAREPGAVAGQSVLTVVNPPEGDMGGLVGTEIWGNASQIMVGDKLWAKRIGYTRIELIQGALAY